ncbi:MAG: YcgN family cysteine cluster protein [Pseudomonadota bacterium]
MTDITQNRAIRTVRATATQQASPFEPGGGPEKSGAAPRDDCAQSADPSSQPQGSDSFGHADEQENRQAKHRQAAPRPRHDAPFWERLSLEEMSTKQWESLCDGCGRCCLSKLEDIDTGAIAFTCVSCTLLDTRTGKCSDYANRFQRVPDCLAITPEMARTSPWLPPTCAYRRLAEGRGLAWWHPLISGDPETVKLAGVSAAGRVFSEDDIDEDDLEGFIVNWPDDDVPDQP